MLETVHLCAAAKSDYLFQVIQLSPEEGPNQEVMMGGEPVGLSVHNGAYTGWRWLAPWKSKRRPTIGGGGYATRDEAIRAGLLGLAQREEGWASATTTTTAAAKRKEDHEHK